jgi:hypothetical protein
MNKYKHTRDTKGTSKRKSNGSGNHQEETWDPRFNSRSFFRLRENTSKLDRFGATKHGDMPSMS